MKKYIATAAFAVSVAFAGGMSSTTTAFAQAPDNCTPIVTVPFTISSSGVYCLTGNLGTNITSGAAIEIAANNVTLDFQGYRLGGRTAGPDTIAAGVAAVGQRNIVVRNGTIRGFGVGIVLVEGELVPLGGPIESSSSGHLVENNIIDLSSQGGILIGGVGVTVRNNQVINTQREGGTVSPPPIILDPDSTKPQAIAPGAFRPRGISVTNARDSLIEGNLVSGTYSPNGAYGIEVAQSSGVNVLGNTVSFTSIEFNQSLPVSVNAPPDEPTLAGIAVATFDDGINVIRENTILFSDEFGGSELSSQNGVALATAGIMRAPSDRSNVGCIGNTVGGTFDAFSGCSLLRDNINLSDLR